MKNNRKPMRAQARQPSTETATVQLGGGRQILRVEGLHSRGKERIIYIQCTRTQQNHHSEKLVGQKGAALYRKFN